MFYLMMYSTHFIYGYMVSDIMVKDHSDSERENPLPPWIILSKEQQGIFYMHQPTYTTVQSTAIITPVVEHWLE